jgi:hypothetical protein
MNTNKKINSCPDEKPGTANGSPVEIWIIEDDSDLRQELQELLNTCIAAKPFPPMNRVCRTSVQAGFRMFCW